jgi:hypothetical protein
MMHCLSGYAYTQDIVRLAMFKGSAPDPKLLTQDPDLNPKH